MAPALQLLPAVDVADGQAVRLLRARPEPKRPTVHRAMRRWPGSATVRSGAHGRPDAAFGRGTTGRCWPMWIAETDVDVELSGGIRDDDSLAAALPPAAPGQSGDRGDREPAVVRVGDRRVRRQDRRRIHDVTADGDSWRLRGRQLGHRGR